MRVKIIGHVGVLTPDGPKLPGEEADVPDYLALDLLHRGAAEAVEIAHGDPAVQHGDPSPAKRGKK